MPINKSSLYWLEYQKDGWQKPPFVVFAANSKCCLTHLLWYKTYKALLFEKKKLVFSDVNQFYTMYRMIILEFINPKSNNSSCPVSTTPHFLCKKYLYWQILRTWQKFTTPMELMKSSLNYRWYTSTVWNRSMVLGPVLYFLFICVGPQPMTCVTDKNQG